MAGGLVLAWWAVGMATGWAATPALEPRAPAADAAGTNDLWRLGGPLPTYHVEIAPSDLRGLAESAYTDGTRPIRFMAGGTVFEGARLRHRGQWARGWPKKPLKVFFDAEQRFHGHRSLNLNSGWRDPAFVREVLAYHVFAVCGAPAPRARMVRVDLNGSFHGLYVEVEQPDRTLLQRHGLKGATLFKTSSPQNMADERDLGDEANFARHYTNETSDDGGVKDLQAFCSGLARANDVGAFLEQHVDVDRYTGYLVATALVQHWDGYTKNHFLVFDGKGTRKWCVLPWDLDRTLGDHWEERFDVANLPLLLGTRREPSIIGWNRLQDRFLGVPALRAKFKAHLARMLATEFTPEKLFPQLDRLESSIATTATMDRRKWRSPAGDLHSGMLELKQFIQARRAFLLRGINQL